MEWLDSVFQVSKLSPVQHRVKQAGAGECGAPAVTLDLGFTCFWIFLTLLACSALPEAPRLSAA